MRRSIRRFLPLLLLVLALGAVGVWYLVFDAYASMDLMSAAAGQVYVPAPPTQGNVTAEGTIVPRRQAALVYKTGGAVADLPVKEGDVVQAGAVLARLEDADLRNQAKQVAAALNVAKSELAQQRAGASAAERQAALDALSAAEAKYDDTRSGKYTDSSLKQAAAAVSQAKSIMAQLDPSPEAIAVAQARVDQAQAAYAAPRPALDQASLKAPFPGTIAQVKIHVGDFVGPGVQVMVIGDLTGLRIETSDISDLDIARVTVGQNVNVTLTAIPGRVFHGTVALISPVASESRGYKVFRVVVDLKEGTANGLRWGMDAKIDVQTK